jgi:cell division protein FtsL
MSAISEKDEDTRDSATTLRSVERNLRNFHLAQSGWIDWFIRIVAAICFIFPFILRSGGFLWYSSWFAAGGGILLVQVLQNRYAAPFIDIWFAGIFVKENISQASTSDPLYPLRSYLDDLEGIRRRFNRPSWKAATLGIAFGAIGGIGFLLTLPGQRQLGIIYYATIVFLRYFTRPRTPTLLMFFLYITIGAVVGLTIWRMWVIAYGIWMIDRNFNLYPKIGHPDKHGGLLSLGNLCLTNTIPLLVPSVFFAFFLFITPVEDALYKRWFFYLTLLLFLLWLAIFVVPTFALRRIMVAKRAKLKDELYRLGKEIARLQYELLQAVESETEEINDKAKQLENLKNLYEDIDQFPMLPFRFRRLMRFVTPQIFTVLSLTGALSGLDEPFLEIIKNFVESLTTSQ